QPICPDGSGSIAANPSNGYEPYSLMLNGMEQATLLAENLSSGIYFTTVEDGFGCLFQDTLEITAADPIAAIGLAPIAITDSPGGNTDYYISGGTPPYSVQWFGPNGFLSNDLNLPPLTDVNQTGNYTIVITDIYGCSFSQNFLITELEELEEYDLKIYPNPNRGIMTIDGKYSGHHSIIDLYGRNVTFKFTKLRTGGAIIHLDSVAGTYILTDDVLGWKRRLIIIE
ncbi:MAG: hypothetical protein ACKOW8_09670, partial [Flavobacteriales bacterium]